MGCSYSNAQVIPSSNTRNASCPNNSGIGTPIEGPFNLPDPINRSDADQIGKPKIAIQHLQVLSYDSKKSSEITKPQLLPAETSKQEDSFKSGNPSVASNGIRRKVPIRTSNKTPRKEDSVLMTPKESSSLEKEKELSCELMVNDSNNKVNPSIDHKLILHFMLQNDESQEKEETRRPFGISKQKLSEGNDSVHDERVSFDLKLVNESYPKDASIDHNTQASSLVYPARKEHEEKDHETLGGEKPKLRAVQVTPRTLEDGTIQTGRDSLDLEGISEDLHGQNILQFAHNNEPNSNRRSIGMGGEKKRQAVHDELAKRDESLVKISECDSKFEMSSCKEDRSLSFVSKRMSLSSIQQQRIDKRASVFKPHSGLDLLDERARHPQARKYRFASESEQMLERQDLRTLQLPASNSHVVRKHAPRDVLSQLNASSDFL